MARYEAVINVTVEVEANDSDEADSLVLGEFTDKLLALGLDKFAIWAEVIDINETTKE